MALGRRPREVYRTFSEEELLEGDTGLYEQPGDPAPEPGPLSGLAQTGASGKLAARSRAILLTVLATLLGLTVGLAAVTLIDGGGLPDVGGGTPGVPRPGAEPTAGAGLSGLPMGQGARGRARDGSHRAPLGRRVAAAAARPPLSHAVGASAPEAPPKLTIGDEVAPTSAPAPPLQAAPAPAPTRSDLSLVAREAGSEFGFER